MSILCILFGHTGQNTESGYHVCDRCGLHEYWCNRQTMNENLDYDLKFSYDECGILMRPIWRLWNRFDHWNFHRKLKNDDDIPF